VLADVYSNGTVYCTPPALLTTQCKLLVDYFPFDEKNCKIKFGSWMYTSNYIMLYSEDHILYDNYISNFNSKILELYISKNYKSSFKVNSAWDLEGKCI